MTTGNDLKAWERTMRREREWGRVKCAAALGVSYHRYQSLMSKGKNTISPTVGLAMTAVFYDLPPFVHLERPLNATYLAEGEKPL